MYTAIKQEDGLTYKLIIPQFGEGVDGSQVELKPLEKMVTIGDITTTITNLNNQISSLQSYLADAQKALDACNAVDNQN